MPPVIPFLCASLNSLTVALRIIPFISVIGDFLEDASAAADGFTPFGGVESFTAGIVKFICLANSINLFFSVTSSVPS